MKTDFWPLVVLTLCVGFLLSGCSIALPDGQVVEVPLNTYQTEEKHGDSAANEAEDAPELVTFPLAPTPDTAALSAREIFSTVSPAVAYVETPIFSGSAVLVEPGYLVTNAHVVWPFSTVRLAFPDGTEYEDVAVLAWDLVTDLAILEAPAVDISPLQFADVGGLDVGSEFFLIGYPGEIERFPQPALTRGLLARVREWAPAHLTLFQIDADVSGGQSGGPLVNEHGQVIGVTTLSFADAGYALVSSATDIAPRLEQLINEDGVAFSDRRPQFESTATEYIGQLDDDASQDLFFLDTEPQSEIRLQAAGPGGPFIVVIDPYGEFIGESELRPDGTAILRFGSQGGGLLVAAVQQMSTNRNRYVLESSAPLISAMDLDDGTTLVVGETYSGAIDVPGETDDFELYLAEGERIVVEVDSLMIDPIAAVVTISSGQQKFVMDDDGGRGGLFGVSARLIFEADDDGPVQILVSDSYGNGHGGYFLSVAQAGEDELVTEPTVSMEFYQTQFGLVEIYENERFDISIKYPATHSSEECPPEVLVCFSGPTDQLLITPESSDDVPSVGSDLERYANLMEPILGGLLPGSKFVARESVTTAQGLAGIMLTYSAYGGQVQLQHAIYLDEGAEGDDGLFYNITYVYSLADVEDALIAKQNADFGEYLLSSLYVGLDSRGDSDPLAVLERGQRLSAQREWDDAIAIYSSIIEQTPDIAEAYVLRAAARYATGDVGDAIADIETLLELAQGLPAESTLRSTLALYYWTNDETEQALAESDKVLALEPEARSEFNNRVLYHATTGDYDAALAELEIFGDDLPVYVLDSRAYVHLLMGNDELALADYEEALAQDFQPVQVLLGAGITHSRSDRLEEGLPLLEYGMENLEDIGLVTLDPQMEVLLRMAQEIMAQND